VAWFEPDPATAGRIAGRVLIDGRLPRAARSAIVDMDGDPLCDALHPVPVREEIVATRRAPDGMRLANVFVYLRDGLEQKRFAPPTEPVTIEQQGCWFAPRILGIQVGQPFEVVNADPLTHNIHPLAQINRDWNQSQSPGDAPLKRRFSQPEVMIRVKCNIHPWMRAWVGVVPHPYFAVTSPEGTFDLTRVPPGSYVLEAWHEALGRIEQRVTVDPGGASEMVLRFQGES
jgi:plastocyanin